MKHTNRNVARWAGLLLVMMVTIPASAQQEKLAQTGMKFLSLSLDSRAAALGDAVTAAEGGAEMLFYNPAGMANVDKALSVSFGMTEWIADIRYEQASLAIRPAGGRFGVFGFSLASVDYGDIQGTMWADTESGYMDTYAFRPSAMAAGIGYARSVTDRFSFGLHAKYARQDLGSHVTSFGRNGTWLREGFDLGVWAYDFGVLYKTGYKSLNFAFSARNFAKELEYVEEAFQLPLTLKMGLQMDVLDVFRTTIGGTQSLTLAIDAETPRDYHEQIKVGLEYALMDMIYLRAGYVTPTDEQGLNLGVGVRQELGGFRIKADYAYTDFGVFSDVQRLSVSISR